MAKKKKGDDAQAAPEVPVQSRLLERYKAEIIPALAEKLGRKNVMSLPKLEKIVISMGVGAAIADKKHMEDAVSALSEISARSR